MNRKIINIIVIFVIMQGIFLFYNICAASNEKVSFSVSNGVGKVGEEVSIEVKLNNDSNFSSANLVLNYNPEHLEYVSHAEGEVLKTGAMCIVKNNSETGKIAIGYIGDPSNTDITIKAGQILKVVFKIKSNIEETTELKLECTSLKNDAGNDIINTITNGKIEKEVIANKPSEEDDSNNNNNKPSEDDNNNNNNNKPSEDDNRNNNNNNNNNTNKPSDDDNNNDTNKPSEDDNNNNNKPSDDDNSNNNKPSDDDNSNNNKPSDDDNNSNKPSDNNKPSGNNNASGNVNNSTNNNTQAENKIPHAGLSETIQFIIISIILISVSIILYKKNKFMREIK